MTKILNENLKKLDEIQNLALVTLKMNSWPQRPRKGLSDFFSKITILKSVHQTEKNEVQLGFIVKLLKLQWSHTPNSKKVSKKSDFDDNQ